MNAAGLPEFRPLYDALQNMGFYNLNPDEMRRAQPPDTGTRLDRDGWNVASVLLAMTTSKAPIKQRIEEYLAQVAPGVAEVEVKQLGSEQILEFRQTGAGQRQHWRFPALSMSDGTIRALGVLVALFQSPNGSGHGIPLVAIEEPEATLHPAAAGVLRDSLRDACQFRQVIVTSHSPDLLDDSSIESQSILAVVTKAGVSQIGPIDAAGRNVLREQLYTPGELLRLNQLEPDQELVQGAKSETVQLFDKAS
jgi:predicted ATPase